METTINESPKRAKRRPVQWKPIVANLAMTAGQALVFGLMASAGGQIANRLAGAAQAADGAGDALNNVTPLRKTGSA